MFKLQKFFNIESEVDYKSSVDLRNALAGLSVNLTHVNLLTPGTENHLQVFLRAANIDMEPYRRKVIYGIL